MAMFRNHIYLLFLIPAVYACHDSIPPSQSFYYWKTVFQLKSSEREALTTMKTDRLYIRYFDVIQDLRDGVYFRPDATIVFKDSIPSAIEIIPVIFVVNNVLTGLPVDSMDILAGRICHRIENINRVHHITKVPEIQMDCDWNVSTRDKYFKLLNAMRGRLHTDQKQLSATLRLHQFKYRKSTGIPPVDKATLMCYNMGRLTEYGQHNSILNVSEIQDYLQGSAIYPLPVDIALPLFCWGVCFSNRQYRGLINGLSKADMRPSCFREIEPNLYLADSSIVLHGTHIRKGDHIRLEEPSIGNVKKTVRLLAERIKTPEYVIWYHLDSLLLQKYPDHERQETVGFFR